MRFVFPLFLVSSLVVGSVHGQDDPNTATCVELTGTGTYYCTVDQAGLTWDAARTAAEGRTFTCPTNVVVNGQLATFDSPADLATISSNFDIATRWIGATDVEEEGTWKWIDGGGVLDEAFWIPGSPTNHWGSQGGEQCATLQPDGNVYGKVEDTRCWLEAELITYITEYNCPADTSSSTQNAQNRGSGSGDPHFKTWTGDKYDYHGECDLVLVDNPTFDNGKGLKIHIQTTRVKYFSYIEKVAIQIGADVLEFSNDVKNFLINGKKVEEQRKYHMTYLDRFVVRRDKKAISIRLSEHKQNGPKIDLIQRNNGFPAVIVDGGSTDMFKGSLGLLGEWSTGKRIARDGKTEMSQEDATAFAEEWQVRDTEPMLFENARSPQFPSACIRPDKMAKSRLGMAKMQTEAKKACAHWKEDMEDCIFDVIATRDILVAEEGHLEQHLQ